MKCDPIGCDSHTPGEYLDPAASGEHGCLANDAALPDTRRAAEADDAPVAVKSVVEHRRTGL
jgi:hypothetical protein